MLLSGNQLTGTIPTQLGDLDSIQGLGLGYNRLTGAIPAQLGDLSSTLSALYLEDNRLSGAIPAELGSLSWLSSLGLGHNQLTGAIPRELANLTNLDVLLLGGNQLDLCDPIGLKGALFEPFANLQSGGVALAICSGVVTSADSGMSEGDWSNISVRLATKPDADVAVKVTGSGNTGLLVDTDPSPSAVSNEPLIFTPSNWASTQYVYVRADEDVDGVDDAFALSFALSSADPSYDGRSETRSGTVADNELALIASGVTATGATLTISNHTGAWYYRRSLPTVGACSWPVAPGTSSVPLSGLSPNTSYTFKAYSDSTCTSAMALTGAATDARFTTGGLVVSRSAVPVPEGSSATYTVRWRRRRCSPT